MTDLYPTTKVDRNDSTTPESADVEPGTPAPEGAAPHEPIAYQLERVTHYDPSAFGVWDGVVIIARTDDEAADVERARARLESMGLMGCGCCELVPAPETRVEHVRTLNGPTQIRLADGTVLVATHPDEREKPGR